MWYVYIYGSRALLIHPLSALSNLLFLYVFTTGKKEYPSLSYQNQGSDSYPTLLQLIFQPN